MAKQCYVWEFRTNAEGLDREVLNEWLKGHCKKWTYQLEKGEQTGYLHYQGRLSLIKKVSVAGKLKLFDEKKMKAFNYFEPTVTEIKDDEAFYSMKAQTRVEGPFTNKDPPKPFVPIQFRGFLEKLYPFQKDILDNKHFNFRTINLIYDGEGNLGKSTVAALGSLHYGYKDIPTLNDFEKIMQIMFSKCNEITRDPGCVFFDMPRALDKSRLCGLYSALEQIKKGLLFDPRYAYKEWWINSPNIWVFSNHYPDSRLLSNDRWKIWTVGHDKELVEFKPSNFPGVYKGVIVRDQDSLMSESSTTGDESYYEN